MFGSTIFDVAIGLIFVYFLLSVITSHVNELISQWFRWRATHLEEGVRNMLADPDLANKVWNHPMIRSLAVRTGRDPSYIPANTFSLALFDSLVPSSGGPTAFESMRAQIMSLPSNSARDSLLQMLDQANGNLVAARTSVEGWFNSAMDRVSGAYKQRLMWVTLLVSILITFLFGVDSIALSNTLWNEPGLRSAVAGAATAFPASESGESTSLQDAIKVLNSNNLPVGWGSFPSTLDGWLRKAMGLILTSLAVALGAPFWFDVLKKVVNLRGSGPPPQERK